MLKQLYANGCSWTAGNGLHEDKNITEGKRLEEYAWPHVLGNKFGLSVINNAEGAGSNQRVLRTTTDFVKSLTEEQRKETLVVIGWSTPERGEIYLSDEHVEFPGWYKFNAAQKFSDQFHPSAIIPKDYVKKIDDYQRMYVEYVHSQHANLVNYFQQKYLLSNLLENLEIKYCFFNSLPGIWVPEPELMKFYNEQLASISTPNMVLSTEMHHYLREKQIKLSSCIHPMIDGHRVWAEYLETFIKNLYGDNL